MDIMYALQSNIERLLDDSDPMVSMANDTEADCLISDQSPPTESEALLVPTNSQLTSDGDIPACKKLKFRHKDFFIADDEIDMYLQLKPPNVFEGWKVNEPRFSNVSKLRS